MSLSRKPKVRIKYSKQKRPELSSVRILIDHPDLSTPANYFDGEGIGNKGKFTVQGTNEFASDKKTCTVPGGSTGAGMEFTLVGSIGISRFSATGDLTP
jgi:hypothetical protein